MTRLRKHLSYANVMSTIAVFLLLGGSAAIAARKVPKGSIGPRQLRVNAVRTPKIKANAVTTRKLHRNAVATIKVRDGAITNPKLADNSVTGAKLADGAVTGADIDASSTPFGRVVHEARGSSAVALPEGEFAVYPLGESSYVQPAGRDDTLLAGLDVLIPASCTGLRKATVGLLVDPGNPLNPGPTEFLATRSFEETGSDPRQVQISLGPAALFQPGAPTQRNLYLVGLAFCEAGGGVTATGGGIDVIGTE